MSETSPLSLTRARVVSPPVRHPAIHAVRSETARSHRLFPRAQDVQREKREREAAIRRHPAGKASAARSAEAKAAFTPAHVPTKSDAADPEQQERAVEREVRCGTTHRVRRGDSLWALATSVAPSASPAEVQRLTEQIFRLNRGTIGSDPDLIHPGQVLSLPEGCQQ